MKPFETFTEARCFACEEANGPFSLLFSGVFLGGRFTCHQWDDEDRWEGDNAHFSRSEDAYRDW